MKFLNRGFEWWFLRLLVVGGLAVLVGLLACPAHAQDETLPPTGTIESTSNSCTTGNAHTTCDDGVPGLGDYCTSSTCGANPTNDTAWHFTFNTPGSNPSTATNAQVFAATLKSCASGGTDSTCRLDFHCSGSLVESGSEQTISSSTGQDITESFTYSSGTCGASGENAEVRVVCTASSGNPANRRVGDLDSVEWRVTYAVAGGAVKRRTVVLR